MLVTFAIAAAILGATAAYNVAPSRDGEFGSANQRLLLANGAPGEVARKVDEFKKTFGTLDVIAHATVADPRVGHDP